MKGTPLPSGVWPESPAGASAQPHLSTAPFSVVEGDAFMTPKRLRATTEQRRRSVTVGASGVAGGTGTCAGLPSASLEAAAELGRRS